MKNRKNLIVGSLIIFILVLFSGENVAEAAVVRVKMYGAASFYPVLDNMEFTNFGNYIVNVGSTDVRMLAKVELPNGAKIKKIKLWAYDNTPQDVCLWIVRTKPRKADWADMNAGLCSTGASVTEPRVFATTAISPRLIANKNNTYHLVIKISPGSSTDLKFWGVDIVYVK